MAQPYIGEVRMFAGNFAPVGWEFCAGQQVPIEENEALFQLIGTTYGGDGESSFNLPDLRGRVPIHWGNGVNLAESAGAESVTLTSQQVPVHTHPFVANSTAGQDATPTGAVLAGSPNINFFREAAPGVALTPLAMGPVGGSQPHTNFQPYLCVNFIISMFGIFPTPT
ncbi:MAG TPA: tail fiber protein [Solirubrobacteraceae bacterium]|nr:tail fiber protein [Solirubrobacteraceae bacterium]